MGISGTYAKKFSEANLASCVDLHLDGGYPHVFFDVVKVEGKSVTLKSHGDGSIADYKIHQGRHSEYAEIVQKGRMVFWRSKPEKFQIVPFKGERF